MYKKWLAEVDSYIGAELGFSLHDVEDYPWSDWYEDQVSAQDTASEYISDWKYDHGFFPREPMYEPPSDIEALLKILYALDRFPELIPDYELAPLQRIEQDVNEYGIYTYRLQKYDAYGVYDPEADVWLVSRILTVNHNTRTIWSWDNVDHEWSKQEWKIA